MRLLSKRRTAILLILASVLQKVNSTTTNVRYERFRSYWSGTRRWLGPEYWTNPLQEWRLKDGAVVAPAAWNRTLCILPFEVEDNGYDFEMLVTVRLSPNDLDWSKRHMYNAGFRFARQGRVNDYRNALLDPKHFIDAYVNADGRLTVHQTHSQETFDVTAGTITLKLTATRNDVYARVILNGYQNGRTITVEQWFHFHEILGSVSILSNGPGQPGKVYNSFTNLVLGGDLLKAHWPRNFGPIVWSQYTLNGENLRILVQTVLLEESIPVELWIRDDAGKLQWRQESWLDVMSRTSIFNIWGWDGSKGRDYEIRVHMFGQTYTWGGFVRKDPKEKDTLKIAAFSCDHGYGFPLPNMVEQVKSQDPDVLFFAGDQIYEIYGGFGDSRTADSNWAMIDFQRKYYQFGWTWRELLRDRPSIIIPDDHDVFQGNLFGHRGAKLENKHPYNWGDGGYIMDAEWVRAVERMHVGHLPDPAYDLTLGIGIKPYFTSLTYGGVGFAILEDRKFKTAPGRIEEWRRKNGEGADLFGPEQERFMSNWAHNWEGQELKIALSQTILAKATTHETPELKRINYDHDSGGWPNDARNRAVRILGDHNVLSIHGDQHLGVLLRHGVEKHGDAGYAFMVPGTANGWPRAWWPGLKFGQTPEQDKCYLGNFWDDSGHPITVLGVGNPIKGSYNLQPDQVDVSEIAYRKGSGYGLVELNKKDKSAKINLFRTGRWYEQFENFPQTIYIGGEQDRWTNHDRQALFDRNQCSNQL